MAKWIWKKYDSKPNYAYNRYKGKRLYNVEIKWEEVDYGDDPYYLYRRASIYKAKVYTSGLIEKGNELTDNEKISFSGESEYYIPIWEGKEYLGTNVNTYGKIWFQEVYEIEQRRDINGYSRGSYIGEVTADENEYKNNQRNSDGYWYVRDRIANIFYNQNKAINKFYNQNKLLKVIQQEKEW